MKTPACSKCKAEIPESDVNVANDVAFCRRCNLAQKLSAMVHGIQLDTHIDLNRPPPGAWYRSGTFGPVLGATHRSIGVAIGTLAVCLFWNGIVSVFVLLAVSSTLNLLNIPAPEWFPVPRMNDDVMGVGMTIFLWLFLTPFIAIGLAMIGAFLSALAGRTEVRLRPSEGAVFTGIGLLGWSRRFNPQNVKDVRMDEKRWRDSDGDRQSKTEIVIELQEGKAIRFGSMLREERRLFVAAGTRKLLIR